MEVDVVMEDAVMEGAVVMKNASQSSAEQDNDCTISGIVSGEESC